MLNSGRSTLKPEVKDGIASIRSGHLEVLNRFDELAHVGFAGALDAIGRDPTARALILSVEGNRRGTEFRPGA